MARKIKLKPHDTLEQWHDNIKRTRNNEHKLKMLVIEKIMANPTVLAKEVQKTFFISQQTMYNWINAYNAKGLEGLTAKSEKGRGSGKGRTKVADEVFLKLKEQMLKEPNKKWTLKVKSQYIKDETGIELTEQGIAYRMKKI